MYKSFDREELWRSPEGRTQTNIPVSSEKREAKMYSSGVNKRNTCMKQNHWGRQIDYLDRASREKNPRADGRSGEGKKPGV